MDASFLLFCDVNLDSGVCTLILFSIVGIMVHLFLLCLKYDFFGQVDFFVSSRVSALSLQFSVCRNRSFWNQHSWFELSGVCRDE